MTMYAGVRVATMIFGWLLALLLGLAVDLMLAGAKWPLAVVLGSWWTLACAMLVRGEAHRPRDPMMQEFARAARQAKAALERDGFREMSPTGRGGASF
jgi:hypothetical protein